MSISTLTRIDEICSTISETYRGKDKKVILINTSDVLEGKILNFEEVENKNLRGQFKKTFKKNDILFSEIRPANKRFAFVNIDDTHNFIASTKLMVLRPNLKRVLPEFLYYILSSDYLLSEMQHLAETRSGTFPQITFSSELGPFEIELPDINCQRKIVSILKNIDEKIELNNEINDNLYDQIKKYFIHLFIENEQSVSWEKKNIGYLVEKTIGGDWGKEASTGNYTEKVYCIRGADIPDIKYGNKGKMPIRFILPKNYTNKKLNSGDLVVEISGGSPTQSTGRVAFISNSLLNQFNNGLVCTNFCRAVTPKNEWSLFLYTLWQYLYDKDLFFTYENGTTGIKNFDLTGFLDNEEFSVPPMELLRKFNNLCVSSLELIFENGIENERLANIRDSLLPKLMSGEIDVDSIEL